MTSDTPAIKNQHLQPDATALNTLATLRLSVAEVDVNGDDVLRVQGEF